MKINAKSRRLYSIYRYAKNRVFIVHYSQYLPYKMVEMGEIHFSERKKLDFFTLSVIIINERHPRRNLGAEKY